MCWSGLAIAATGGLVLGLATCSSGNLGPGSATMPTLPPQQQVESDSGFAILGTSAVHLSGQATIGSWDSVSHQVHGDMLADVQPAVVHAWFDRWEQALRHGDSDQPINIPSPTDAASAVQLRVPVASLKTDSDGMQRDMLAALKAEQHPLIEYRLLRVTAVEIAPSQDDSSAPAVVRLTTVGELTLAGEVREIEMPVTAQRLADGRFSLVGRRELKMTDFNITPPSALFGLIRAKDTVQVVFDLIVGSQQQPTPAQ